MAVNKSIRRKALFRPWNCLVRVLVSALVLPVIVAGFAAGEERGEPDEAIKKSYKKGKNYCGFCMICHGNNGKGTVLDKGGGDGSTSRWIAASSWSRGCSAEHYFAWVKRSGGWDDLREKRCRDKAAAAADDAGG
jgi:hypothetical protein